MYRTQVKKLNAYMMWNLREIMKITWKDRVSNGEIYRRCGLAPMTDILIEHTFLCKLAMRSKVLKLSLSLSNVKQVKVLAVVLTVGFAS